MALDEYVQIERRKEGCTLRDQGNIDLIILQQLVLQIDSEWPTHETHVPTTANSIYVIQTYASDVLQCFGDL